jgi:hypothetical protein
MPKRKRHSKHDEDIIRTEPDKRRATGREEDDNFEEPFKPTETAIYTPIQPFMRCAQTVRSDFCRRSKTRPPTNQKGAHRSHFPFLLLPAEIRNEIYRHIVVSRSDLPIRLSAELWIRSGGISTAILLACYQVGGNSR